MPKLTDQMLTTTEGVFSCCYCSYYLTNWVLWHK